jgi:hypothetical protein
VQERCFILVPSRWRRGNASILDIVGFQNSPMGPRRTTEKAMREGHRLFVSQAFEKLWVGGG